ncbi:MAG: YkvA family protein [Dehalococcoidia bacterium]
MVGRLREWARRVKREVHVLVLAARDERTPWYAKLMAVSVAAYALSPIDLIPDVIPVLGYLDDLLLVPAGMVLTLRLVPPKVIADARERAWADNAERMLGRRGAATIVALWLAAVASAAAVALLLIR